MNNEQLTRLEARIDRTCESLGIDPELHGQRLELVERLRRVAGDELTDPDLRVIVRVFNRETIGRTGD